VGDSLQFFGDYLRIVSDTAADRDWVRTSFIKNEAGGGDGRIGVWSDAYGIRGEGNLRWDDPNYELEIDGRIYFGGRLISYVADASHTPGFLLEVNETLSNTDTVVQVLHNAKTLMLMYDDSTAHVGDFHNTGDMDVTGESSFYDTIRYNAVTSPTRYGWLYMDSSTYSINVDSLKDAGFGLTDELILIGDYLSDTQNGELKWFYKENQGVYGISRRRPGEIITALQWQSEHLLRYINEQDKRIDKFKTEQRLLLGFILLILILIAGYIRKCLKR